MPVVPTSRGPSVEAAPIRITAPTPEVYSTAREAYQQARGVDPNAFGAQLAEVQMQGAKQLGQAADQISLLATKMQIEENEREVKRLSNEFAASRQIIGYGDGTPENRGYYATNGENAVAGAGAAKEAIKKERERLMASASNGRVRQLFEERANADTTEEHGRIDRFVLKEREVAADLASKGRQAAAANEAATVWNDPKVMDKNIGIITAEVLEYADRKGIKDPIVVGQLIREARTPAIQGAVKSALAAEDTVAAEAIFAKNKFMLDAGTAAALEKEVRNEGNTKQAQIISDQAFAKFPNDPVAGRQYIKDALSGKVRDQALEKYNGDIGAARGAEADNRARVSFAQGQQDRAGIGKAQKISDELTQKNGADTAASLEAISKMNLDPQTRNRAEAEVRERGAALRQRDTLAEHNLDVLYRQQERARKEALDAAEARAGKAIESGASWSSLPQADRELLQAEGKAAHFLSREKQIATGAPLSTDWKFYQEAMAQTPEQFRTADPMEARTKLSDTEFSQWTSRYNQAQQGKGDPNDPFSPVALFNAKAKKLGLMEEGKQKQYGAAFSLFQEELLRLEKANGPAKVTGDVKLQLRDQILDKVVIDGALFGTNEVPLYKLEVPKDKLSAVRAKLQAAGVSAPTEVQMRQMYVIMQKNAREKK